MKCPILEEVRRIKRQRAAQCGYDIKRLGEEARKFVDALPEPDPAIFAEIEELHRQWDIEAKRRGIDLGSFDTAGAAGAAGKPGGSGRSLQPASRRSRSRKSGR